MYAHKPTIAAIDARLDLRDGVIVNKNGTINTV